MSATPDTISDEPPEDQEQLLVMVYDELRRLAAIQMDGQRGHLQTLQPTALVHEAWLRLSVSNRGSWQSRSHFCRTAAIAMRHILTDRARGRSRQKRSGVRVDLSFASEAAEETDPEAQIILMDECLARMEQHYPECARIVQLKFFAGLSNQETAEMLGISLRTVERQWSFARAKLYQMMRGRDEEAEREP